MGDAKLESEAIVMLKGVSVEFDGEQVLKGIDLSIHDKEFVTLLGPSGCGKTTTLRIIGGFLSPDEGSVIFDGKDIKDIPPYKRPVNTVFQKYALFPHSAGEEGQGKRDRRARAGDARNGESERL